MNKKVFLMLGIFAIAVFAAGMASAYHYGYNYYSETEKSYYDGYSKSVVMKTPYSYYSSKERFNYGPYADWHYGYAPYQKHYSHSYTGYHGHPTYHLRYYPDYYYSNKVGRYFATGYHPPTYVSKIVRINY